MKKNEFANYMDSVYELIDEPVNEVDEYGVEYVDGDEDVFVDESDWGDDITYIGEDEVEQDYIDDLGEGYIPLPTGNAETYEVVVIDENYVLDEYETDLGSSVTYVDEVSDEYTSSKDILAVEGKEYDVPELYIEPEHVKSVIKLPETKTLSEELNTGNLNSVDDKISKSIAREYMVDAEASVDLLPGDNMEEDVSWVDNEDLFGNNIDLILADDPDEEVEDIDYVEGSFEDWVKENGESM